MKKMQICLAIMPLLLMPCVADAQDDQSASQGPPIAQPLVREGNFALRLVEVLKLGTAESEAQAETMLTEIGVAPAAGWIADYPVTPDVLAELRSNIKAAADAGKLSLGRDEALQSFADLTAEYGLSLQAATESANAGSEPPLSTRYSPSQTIINNYYDDWGPPVLTWYRPPWDYFYLYAWISFPFWYDGFWFPGYFCLRDFDRVIVLNGCGRSCDRRCTNHLIIDRDSRTVRTIDPVKHAEIARNPRIRASGIPPRSSLTSAVAPAVRAREIESSPQPSRFSADDQKAARTILDRQLRESVPPRSMPAAQGQAYGNSQRAGSDSELGVQGPRSGLRRAKPTSGYVRSASKEYTTITPDRATLSSGIGSRKTWGESSGSSTRAGSGNGRSTIAPREGARTSPAPVRAYEQGAGFSASPKSSTGGYSAPPDRVDRLNVTGMERTAERMDRPSRAFSESPPEMQRSSLGAISGMGSGRSPGAPSAPGIDRNSSGGFQGRGLGMQSR